jgi:holo-[acyl-carrier protein] synthase
MKILIGIDIQSIDEVEASIAEFGGRYLERVYTSHELDACAERSHWSAAGLADRFAAKEAVMKVLDASDLPWKEIEIQMNAGSGTVISLSGVAAERAKRQGVGNLMVSLSHTDRLATAIVAGEMSDHETESIGNR